MFVDSHAHLDLPDFESDLEQTLKRARDVGVATILTIGCAGNDGSNLSKFLQLLQERNGLYGAVGVHPHDADGYTEELGEKIGQHFENARILGWGEIGLDFHYDNSPRTQQIAAFTDQLRRARACGKPVIIHSREAEELTCQILEQEFSSGPGGVMHCFTGGLETARRILRCGFYVSFGGILTFKNAGPIREVARQISLERLLIETDSPYLAPVPFRGKRNEPAFVVQVAEALGRIHERSTEEIAAITTANFERLFFGQG